MKHLLSIGLLITTFSIMADFPVGPNGINQWRLIYELGQSLNTATDFLGTKIDECCSILETNLTALDLGFLTAIDFAQLTVIEPLISTLEACDLCSHFSLILTDVDSCCSTIEQELQSVSDVLGSKIDIGTGSNIAACCSTLSVLDTIIKSDIDSVSTKVDSVGSQVSQVKSDLDACCSTLSSLDVIIKSDVDAVSSKIDTLGTQSEACCSSLSLFDVIIKSDIDSVSTKVDSVGSQVSQVKSDLDACCSNLSVLDVIIKSDVDSVSTKVDSVGSQVSQVKSDLDACCSNLSVFDTIIKSDIDSVSTKVDSVGSQISQVKSDLDACCSTLSSLDVIIKSDVDAVSSKIDTLGTQSEACCSSLSLFDVIIKSDIDSVSTKVDSVGSQVLQVKSDLDACCSNLSVLDVIIKSDVDSVSTKVDSVGSQVSQVKSDLDACCSNLSIFDTIIKSDIDSVSTKVDSVGSQISQVKSDLDTCCSSLSSMDTIIKSDVDSVSSKVDIANSVIGQLDACTLGTVITQVPYIISDSGTYTLCSNLTNSSGSSPAITIQANNVLLDLNGYGITSSSTVAVTMTGYNNITIQNGALRADNTESLTTSGCSNIMAHDLQITRSGNGLGFNINSTLNSVFERCYFGNSAVSDSGLTGTVFVIQGSSDGILVKSCIVEDPLASAFAATLNGINSGHGIFFEDCVAGRPHIFGLAAFSVSSNGSLVSFKNCTASLYSIGFSAISGQYITYENCQVSEGSLAGFDTISSSDIIMTNCSAIVSGSGFIFDTCTQGIVQNSATTGGTGRGYLINSCTDMILNSCIMQDFDLNGCEIDASSNITLNGCVAEHTGKSSGHTGYYMDSQSDAILCLDCTAQAGSYGFNIFGNNAVLEQCTATQNGTGILINSGATNTYLLNSCPVNNTAFDLVDNGTNTSNISDCTIASCCDTVGSVCDQLSSCTLGTVITQVPYIISDSGTYTLCSNLTNSSGSSPAITIQANNVLLDLNGYGITSSSTVAVTMTGYNNITIQNGALRADNTESLTTSGCSNIMAHDLQITRSGNGLGFNINSTLNSVFERCYFGNSAVSDSGLTGTVFVIQGSSDGILVKSCIVEDPLASAFAATLNGINSGHGIFFEDCVAGRPHIFGLAAFSVSSNGSLVSFKNCTASLYSIGFSAISGQYITYENCQVSEGSLAGFDTISSSDIIMTNCSAIVSGSGFIFDTCTQGIVQNSATTGGTGRGYLINSCTDMILNSCIMQDFDLNGCEIDASSNITLNGCVAEHTGKSSGHTGYYMDSQSDAILCLDCTAQAGSYGFNIFGNNAVLEQCTATQNGTGILINSGATNTYLLNSCPVNNTAFDLVDNGTNTSNISDCTIASCCDTVGSVCDQLSSCTLGTVITQVPYIISDSGTYTLCSNLTNSSGSSPAITIQANNVLLDLNGYGITSSSTVAVTMTGYNNITIQNGALRADNTESLTTSGCSNIMVHDLQVTRAQNGLGFNINNTLNSVFERCYFGNSVGGDITVAGPVFVIQGGSDGILVKSCTIEDPLENAFSITGSSSGHGIFFEDCVVGRPHIFGSAAFSVSSNGSLVSFKNCTASLYSTGFLTTSGQYITYENCLASECNSVGFDTISSTDIIMNNCNAMTSSSGFIFNTCTQGMVQNSSAIGGFGWGYLLTSCADILLESCNAENFLTQGFGIVGSQVTLDICSALNNATGASVSINSPTTIRRSTFDKNGTGITAFATTVTDVIIKDCMIAHSTTHGINDNGTPLLILDTRSYNPGPDITGASTIITY